MSYTYLLEQGEESLAESFLDIPQSVLLRLNLTAKKSCYKDSETESCQSSQSGTMSAPSMEIRGEEKLTSSVEDFPAKISQQQEREPGSQANEADSGERCPESLAKFDPNTHSWRTVQCLLFEDLGESLETFPKWGIMQNGELWVLNTPAQFIADIEFGFLPTPQASDCRGGGMRKLSPHLQDCSIKYYLHARCASQEWKTSYPNPVYIEKLMMWPLEWTDLKPLEMDKFRLWLHSHGKSFHPGVDKH